MKRQRSSAPASGGPPTRPGRRLLAAGLLACAVAAAGCAPLYRSHGFVPSAAEIRMLEPGVDTRETISQTIGRPTAGGVLDRDAFYYVASRFRQIGPLEPQEIERQIVALTFDASGILRNIERFGLQDGRVVALERQVTDDGLRDTTFLRQLIGNFGNFDATQLLGDE